MESTENSASTGDSPASSPRRWKAPTLMIIDVKGQTANITNPFPNSDSVTNYYTSS